MLISQKLVAVSHFSDLFWKKVMLDDQKLYISSMCFLEVFQAWTLNMAQTIMVKLIKLIIIK